MTRREGVAQKRSTNMDCLVAFVVLGVVERWWDRLLERSFDHGLVALSLGSKYPKFCLEVF